MAGTSPYSVRRTTDGRRRRLSRVAPGPGGRRRRDPAPGM